MGMDLTRRRDSKKWSCNNALWRFIIDAAKQSGWIPLGTKIKSEDYVTHNNQDYFSNNGQIVTPEDTESLCENLEKYLNESENDVEEALALMAFRLEIAKREEAYEECAIIKDILDEFEYIPD